MREGGDGRAKVQLGAGVLVSPHQTLQLFLGVHQVL
jgi:hypothetical protein